jgi:protein TonB
VVVPETQSPSTVLWLTRRDYAQTDIANKQGSAKAPDPGNGSNDAPDSALAQGHGPHGEPLYAAEWYREPTDAQLSPYIPERARGRSGWGVIACRTVANYRVEDCQELDDSPRGSGYAGAVRQAAWQFRVRPPRVGGKPLIGTWVRILIRYSVTVVHGDSARPGPEGDSEKPDDQ